MNAPDLALASRCVAAILPPSCRVTSRRGADWTVGGQSHSYTVLSLLPPARHWDTASCPSRVWTCQDRYPRLARRPPGSFATRCATDPPTSTRRWNCRSEQNRSWLLATGWRPTESASSAAFLFALRIVKVF
jgi:hypothetical protein